MEDILEKFIPIIAILCTFGIPGIIIFWAIQSKHRERMRLIEKGVTPEELREYFKDIHKSRKHPNIYSILKWGILLTFVGVGLLVALIMEEAYDLTDDLTPIILLISAGVGFLFYYLIVTVKLKKEQHLNETPSQN